MRYLTKNDFNSKISSDNLDVVTGSSENVLTDTETDVIDEISSYLAGRYDTSKIFLLYNLFEVGESYSVGTILYLLAANYDINKAYALNDTATDGKKIFKAIQGGTGKALNDPDYWLEIGKNNAFYTVKVADAEGVLSNAAHYTAGDPRNALIKRYTVDIVLYELHSRINPRNIPEFRIQRRDDAIAWLKAVQNPRNNINADFLPEKVFGERKGNDISWNSRRKQTNKY
ncbi:DUF1320 domain-containing protein [Flavobacterium phage FPSV-S1]|nr:DUF1320 domain-containing protein [Flavobacterium phage FPSV-S1]QCW20637.1 hypothetical protein [Flavobacterium phage FPSV-S27]